ncbi:MAG: outer membrane lipoprotein-sorting protein [Spirochaetes bacterium]|nr:outer membrane lipoprotein-sorting protein [Spirochaetota bacterium]
MKLNKIIIPVVFIMAAAVSYLYAEITAKEVMRKSIETTRVDGTESLSTLVIMNQNGEKRVRKMLMVSRMYNNGQLEKKMVRFTAPADVKGTGFLSFDYNEKSDDKWMYMPALRKTRRIISSENAKSFMGSEFSYADMSMPTLNDFNYKSLPDETVNGENCYMIEITPKDETVGEENGFSKKISYISKRDFVLRKAEYFDLNGEKEKILEVQSVIEVDKTKHKYKMKKMTMTNVHNNRKSVSSTDSIKFNPGIPDEYFTTRYLLK